MKTGVGIMNLICEVIFQTNDRHVAALTARNASSCTLCTVSVPVSRDRRTVECQRAEHRMCER
jgi:hypothetical protein